MKTPLSVDATLMTLKTNHCECIILSNKIWILQIFFDGLHQYFQSRNTETTNDQNENIKQYLIKFSIL